MQAVYSTGIVPLSVLSSGQSFSGWIRSSLNGVVNRVSRFGGTVSVSGENSGDAVRRCTTSLFPAAPSGHFGSERAALRSPVHPGYRAGPTDRRSRRHEHSAPGGGGSRQSSGFQAYRPQNDVTCWVPNKITNATLKLTGTASTTPVHGLLLNRIAFRHQLHRRFDGI